MKVLVIFTAIAVSIAGCASAPEKKFVFTNGNVATPDQVEEVKVACHYDEKMKIVKDNFTDSYHEAMYDSSYQYVGSQKANKYLDKANATLAELRQCFAEHGMTQSD
ncbi:hypothetical protein QCD60_08240 [Pokkaliibacter sp. MBI-7]|uniref:hypothetical protein n=1 Tax=Pokkaliibacter sp. MBI-7 TaxID=3040600 RepID=UPI002447A080|nr:hypothetical protein [Pokkaliibacter sp. MBI-7]MDH2432553.1 hypothetical protein [Pokkaliibacter sp. MBI-7]